MAEEKTSPKRKNQEEILQQQYLRALSSFEGVLLGRMEVNKRLGIRLNYSIKTGLIILVVIAVSILVLLLTLTTQLNKITGVVYHMSANLSSISTNMDRVREHMDSMEQHVSLMAPIEKHISSMNKDMVTMNNDLEAMYKSVGGIKHNLTVVRDRVGNIAIHMNQMNNEVQAMSHEMHRLGKPARTMNKMMPFP